MDKFYTLPSYSKKCIDKVGEIYGDYSQWRLVIEPSAGNGSFLQQIPSQKKVGMDIEPEGENIMKQSFFDYVPKHQSEHEF